MVNRLISKLGISCGRNQIFPSQKIVFVSSKKNNKKAPYTLRTSVLLEQFLECEEDTMVWNLLSASLLSKVIWSHININYTRRNLQSHISYGQDEAIPIGHSSSCPLCAYQLSSFRGCVLLTIFMNLNFLRSLAID